MVLTCHEYTNVDMSHVIFALVDGSPGKQLRCLFQSANNDFTQARSQKPVRRDT